MKKKKKDSLFFDAWGFFWVAAVDRPGVAVVLGARRRLETRGAVGSGALGDSGDAERRRAGDRARDRARDRPRSSATRLHLAFPRLQYQHARPGHNFPPIHRVIRCLESVRVGSDLLHGVLDNAFRIQRGDGGLVCLVENGDVGGFGGIRH